MTFMQNTPLRNTSTVRGADTMLSSTGIMSITSTTDTGTLSTEITTTSTESGASR